MSALESFMQQLEKGNITKESLTSAMEELAKSDLADVKRIEEDDTTETVRNTAVQEANINTVNPLPPAKYTKEENLARIDALARQLDAGLQPDVPVPADADQSGVPDRSAPFMRTVHEREPRPGVVAALPTNQAPRPAPTLPDAVMVPIITEKVEKRVGRRGSIKLTHLPAVIPEPTPAPTREAQPPPPNRLVGGFGSIKERKPKS